MYKINPSATHLAAEFRAKPIGHHSPDLQKVLNVFRGEAMADKYCLICTKPHQEWVLAQFSGRRGVPPKVHHNRVFTSIDEAEWEVFKMRWEKYTGHKLQD